MTDLGTLSVDLPGGLIVFGWWLAWCTGQAVKAYLGSITVALTAMGAGR
jgi:hypothetical protein